MITWERKVFIVADAVARIFQIFFTTCRSRLQSAIRTKSFKGISENIPEGVSSQLPIQTFYFIFFLSLLPVFLLSPFFCAFIIRRHMKVVWKVLPTHLRWRLKLFSALFFLCGTASWIWEILCFRLMQEFFKDANFMGLFSLTRSKAAFFPLMSK